MSVVAVPGAVFFNLKILFCCCELILYILQKLYKSSNVLFFANRKIKPWFTQEASVQSGASLRNGCEASVCVPRLRDGRNVWLRKVLSAISCFEVMSEGAGVCQCVCVSVCVRV